MSSLRQRAAAREVTADSGETAQLGAAGRASAGCLPRFLALLVGGVRSALYAATKQSVVPRVDVTVAFLLLLIGACFQSGRQFPAVALAVVAVVVLTAALTVVTVLVGGVHLGYDIHVYRTFLVALLHCGLAVAVVYSVLDFARTPPLEAVTSFCVPTPELLWLAIDGAIRRVLALHGDGLRLVEAALTALAGTAVSLSGGTRGAAGPQGFHCFVHGGAAEPLLGRVGALDQSVWATQWVTLRQSRRFWYTVLLGYMQALGLGLAVTAGYHRCFAHKAYKAHGAVQAYFLYAGAGSAQGSVIWWARDHRMHHKFSDTPMDPYPILHGFLWAHVGWILCRKEEAMMRRGAVLEKEGMMADLYQHPWCAFQHRHYTFLLVTYAYLQPMLLAGMGWGDPVGGLLQAGFFAQCVAWQAAQCVNSLAHMWGDKPYNPKISAVQNVFVALLTFGEGWHNYHHSFPSDYRNGSAWWHWDPAKWFISGCSKAGLVWDCRSREYKRKGEAPAEGHSGLTSTSLARNSLAPYLLIGALHGGLGWFFVTRVFA